MPPRFIECQLSSWIELVQLADLGAGFYFRGQSDSRWPLSTSIERTLEKFNPALPFIEHKERSILREFQAKYHLYESCNLEHNEKFEWLALLQHHGCPTRLLDFTFSPYVAAYFAVHDSSTDAVIWAINGYNLRNSIRDVFGVNYDPLMTQRDAINDIHIKLFNPLVATRPSVETPPRLFSLEALRSSHRISRQKGLFLAPSTFGTISSPMTFIDNMAGSLGASRTEAAAFETLESQQLLSDTDLHMKYSCIRFVLPKWIHFQSMKHLNQMGLNEESLFPGLDGFARSLVQSHLR